MPLHSFLSIFDLSKSEIGIFQGLLYTILNIIQLVIIGDYYEI